MKENKEKQDYVGIPKEAIPEIKKALDEEAYVAFDAAKRKLEEEIKSKGNSPLMRELKDILAEEILLNRKIDAEKNPTIKEILEKRLTELGKRRDDALRRSEMEEFRKADLVDEFRLAEITRFRGRRGDTLSAEASQDFSRILGEEIPDYLLDEALQSYCEYYGYDKGLPINYAVDVWKRAGNEEWVKPFVEKAFKEYKDLLTEHFLSAGEAKKIKEWLGLE